MILARCVLLMAVLGAVCAAEAVGAVPGTPASNLLLDEKTLFADTADLVQYASQPTLSGRLTGRGNGAAAVLLEHWAGEFSTIYPQVVSDMSTGGESSGLPELLAGRIMVDAMRRPLTAEEIVQLTTKFGHPPLILAVATDSVAVLVDIKNPLPRLSVPQLQAIYARIPPAGTAAPEIWGDLGVPAPLDKVRIVRCALTPAINQQFRKALLGDGEFRYDLQCSLVPGMMLQSIAAQSGAIGITSVLFATAGTRAVPLTGADGRDHLPTYEEAIAGTYPLSRTLFLVCDPAAGPVVTEFMRFVVSRRGQRIAGLLGAFPLNAAAQQTALAAIK